MTKIKALFLDIGGVLLTNGWDRNARRIAAQTFDLDLDELNERHHLTFDTYEEGKLTLDGYLDRIVFFEPRSFGRETFVQFMYDQSAAHPDMIALIRNLKRQYGLKLLAVNNEGRELNAYRIQHFGLDEFIDAFVSSCYVHLRKPDADLFRMALDIVRLAPEQVVYIDDRAMFVQEARALGMCCLHHTRYTDTVQALANYGLVLPPETG